MIYGLLERSLTICNQRHHVLRLGNTFLANFHQNAEKTIYISDGYFGVQNSYEVYLNRLARDIAPIRITGNYGGELLRSIQGILKAEPFNSELFNADLRPYFETARQTVENLYEAADHPLTSNLFMEIPWFRNIGAVIEQSQLTLRSPYLDNDLVSLFYRCPPELKNRHDLSLRLIKDGNKNLAAIPTDRGFGGNRIFLLSRIAEIYYEFLFKTEYIYNYGMPQSFAAIDGLLKNFKLERFFLGHHKFAHFRIWYRDQLADYIKDILLDSKTLNRSYLKKRNVEKILAAHISGFRNYTIEISKLISVELLHRLLLEDL
jgi:asparagine synthase (glutamine-hydrolysing)